MNRPRRRGTGWFETGVLVAMFIVWLLVGSLVYRPSSDDAAWAQFLWAMAPIFAWTAWLVWYRSRHAEEIDAQTRALLTTGHDHDAADGMVSPAEWQAARWRRIQERRASSRAYRMFWGAVAVAVIAIPVIVAVAALYAGSWQLGVAALVVAAVVVTMRAQQFTRARPGA